MEYYRVDGTHPGRFECSEHFKSILILERDFDFSVQKNFSSWLCEKGCRYAMTFGNLCESWHDALDDANLMRFDFKEIPDNDFIMTTWHDNETLEDVVFFAKHAAIHPTLDLSRLVIFHFGESNLLDRLKKLYAAA